MESFVWGAEGVDASRPGARRTPNKPQRPPTKADQPSNHSDATSVAQGSGELCTLRYTGSRKINGFNVYSRHRGRLADLG